MLRTYVNGLRSELVMLYTNCCTYVRRIGDPFNSIHQKSNFYFGAERHQSSLCIYNFN